VLGFGSACCCCHLEQDVGSGNLGSSLEIGCVVTPAIQCRVCCLLLWHSGPDFIPDWMEQSRNKRLASLAGLSLNGHCEGWLCPCSSLNRLVATGGHCGHMPLLGMDISWFHHLNWRGDLNCDSNPWGSCVARRHSWPECLVILTRTIAASAGVVRATNSNMVGGLPFIMNGDDLMSSVDLHVD